MADEENEQSPFSRPNFIVAAVVVAALVVAGVIVGVNVATRDGGDAQPNPTSSSTAAPSAEPTADSGGASACGLDGEELTGTVTTAPQAEWQYQDVYSYPVSSTAGPAATAPEGYRFCFQHSPTGALFAAANGMVTALAPDLRAVWLDYSLSEGTYRNDLLASAGNETDSEIRASVAGFRVLAYEGDTARIDIAFAGTTAGQVVTGSVVFELIWIAGDWKLDGNNPEPARIAQIPNLAGYTPWGAE
ncbi:hypothetical protein D6T64_04070 [Cryobacterium melibiosiphilum]|uniref:DUF8175 domain-containing protein n=1 Tax=Cryobacterium melibiosiphilum TaxID=995039 RepID=A0A3A5MLT9_9MICO|nr:hypothetical protein [Cryobacterium melibiosiphilum]RJT90332.1 hypothetical protein D6T64_04070 [Cryobacterium melibiosiphilum]